MVVPWKYSFYEAIPITKFSVIQLDRPILVDVVTVHVHEAVDGPFNFEVRI